MADKATIKGYRDLVAWQKAYALGLLIYRLTARFPDSERFGLTSQLRRGIVSVASNIAEGYGRGSKVDYVRFLKIARGALYEVDTQLAFANDLGFCQPSEHDACKALLNECERVLAGLIRSIDPS